MLGTDRLSLHQRVPPKFQVGIKVTPIHRKVKCYTNVPGFLPGAFGGIVPERRQSIPSTGFPSLNLVTLHRDISPRDDRTDSEARTLDSGIPVASAISASICWPCFFRCCRMGVAYIIGYSMWNLSDSGTGKTEGRLNTILIHSLHRPDRHKLGIVVAPHRNRKRATA